MRFLCCTGIVESGLVTKAQVSNCERQTVVNIS
jgi:hypothetical protein